MIPTAEQTLTSILGACSIEYYELKEDCPEVIEQCLAIIISQNKLHVEAALKAAAENAYIEHGDQREDDEINKESILNYDLNQIK